jgi:small subunit ribosomal protein S5
MSRQFGYKKEKKEYEEQVVHIDRIARTVAGGRRIRFRAAVVIGNRSGKVGIGVAKASEVILAVQKAITLAKKHLVNVPIVNDTIPYEIESQFGAAKVLLKPAAPGTGIIAGGAVRAIADLAGIKNLLSKILGSQNQINNLRAMMKALEELESVYHFIKEKEESERIKKIDQTQRTASNQKVENTDQFQAKKILPKRKNNQKTATKRGK